MTDLEEKILVLARQRVKPSLIYRVLSCSLQSVYSTLNKARARGEHIPDHRRSPLSSDKSGIRVSVPPGLYGLLAHRAETRNVFVNDLIKIMLEEALLVGSTANPPLAAMDSNPL